MEEGASEWQPQAYVPYEEAPLKLTAGVTLKMGGKLAELNFSDLPGLIYSVPLLRYLSTEKGCKELCDQYEVWLTAQSLQQHLPLKFGEAIQGRRVYYVAHGSAKEVMFDDKDASAIALSIVEELKLDAGPIVEPIQIRLVGCYSAALVEAVVEKIRKSGKVKLGEGGSIAVKGTVGTYFRKGEQSQMLAKDQTGEGRAQPYFKQSDLKITEIFNEFKLNCQKLCGGLVEKANQCKKDPFLLDFLGGVTAGQATSLVAKWAKRGLKDICGLLVELKQKIELSTPKSSDFSEYCVKLIKEFSEVQVQVLKELLATRENLLTALFQLQGKGVVSKGRGERHITSTWK